MDPSDQREFVTSPKQWKSFLKILDRPVRRKPELARLISETMPEGRRSGKQTHVLRKPE